MRGCFVFAALVALTAGTSGCSSTSAAAVEGKVSYGGEPINVGTITFIPTSGEGIKRGGLIEKGASVAIGDRDWPVKELVDRVERELQR